MSSETAIKDPIKYAQQAIRWGLPEPPASAHPAGREDTPEAPNDWSSMYWMLESRRTCLAWVRKANDEELAELAAQGRHDSLEATVDWPLDPETVEATARTARQALSTRQLRNAAGLVAQRAREQPGVWQDLGQGVDERDAHWIRDMLRRGTGISVKVSPAAPGTPVYHVMAMAVPQEEGD